MPSSSTVFHAIQVGQRIESPRLDQVHILSSDPSTVGFEGDGVVVLFSFGVVPRYSQSDGNCAHLI